MFEKLKNHKILSYAELSVIRDGDSDEIFVDVRKYSSSISAIYDKHEMKAYTGSTIFVRKSVAKKLAKINKELSKQNLYLKVVYGYRHPDIQKNYFKKWKKIMSAQRPDLKGTELDAYTHNFIAVPEVAGHPTGGAVDLTIIDGNGSEIAMGTSIADFQNIEKIKTFYPGLSSTEKKNRKLLHDLMLEQDFAPFYGEWWHFSYGDKEWAAFYGKNQAIFRATELKL